MTDEVMEVMGYEGGPQSVQKQSPRENRGTSGRSQKARNRKSAVCWSKSLSVSLPFSNHHSTLSLNSYLSLFSSSALFGAVDCCLFGCLSLFLPLISAVLLLVLVELDSVRIHKVGQQNKEGNGLACKAIDRSNDHFAKKEQHNHPLF